MCIDGGAHPPEAELQVGHDPLPFSLASSRASPSPSLIHRESIRMIVAEVFTHQPPQVGFIEDDHVIQQFSAAAPHPSFGNPVLPGALIGCSDQFATQGLERLGGLSRVLPASIEDQVTRCRVFGKSFAQLPRDPTAGRVLRGIKVKDLPAAMTDHEEAI